MPVVAPVLTPIFGSIGVARYPTKPEAIVVSVQTASIFTYLQGLQPMNYHRMLDSVISGEVPQTYTAIQTERQLEENLKRVLWARTRKTCPLPREYFREMVCCSTERGQLPLQISLESRKFAENNQN